MSTPVDPNVSRSLDTELARRLGRAEPTTGVRSATYLQELAARLPGSPAVDADLIARAQTGDPGARAQLVELHLPAINALARTYRSSPQIQRTELLQEGVVGLLRALERYEPQRGTPFWAYAVWWVRQAMQQLVSELTRPLVLSDRALRHLARIKDADRAVRAESGREPRHDELAERSGLSLEQVDDLLAVDRVPRSLDEPVPAAGEDSVGSFGELLVDPLAEGEYERMLDATEVEGTLSLLSELSARERKVLRARYGLDGPEQSLREVAGQLGISAERVRQIEQRALGKLAAAARPERESGSRPL